jgi:hypothetical protein
MVPLASPMPLAQSDRQGAWSSEQHPESILMRLPLEILFRHRGMPLSPIRVREFREALPPLERNFARAMARAAKEVSADDRCARWRSVCIATAVRSNFSPIQGIGCTACVRVSDTRCGTWACSRVAKIPGGEILEEFTTVTTSRGLKSMAGANEFDPFKD